MADFTEEEERQLIGMFKTLGAKPKTDTPEDLKVWMEQYVAAQTGLDAAAGADRAPTPGVRGKVSGSNIVTQNPRVSAFSGVVKSDQVSYDVWKYEVKTLLEEGEFSLLHKSKKS